MKKKTLIAVITVALVIALIISCAVPLDSSSLFGGSKIEDQIAPEGMILVNFSTKASIARTIMPDDLGDYTDASDFTLFKLDIINNTDGDASVTTASTPFAGYIDYSTLTTTTNTIALTSGKKYTFTVSAFDEYETSGDDTSPPIYLARGSYIVPTILDANGTITIVLSAIATSTTEKGDFAWDLNVSAYDVATLTLATNAAPTVNILDMDEDTTPEPVNLKTTPSGSTASLTAPGLAPGVYRVVITLSSTGYQTVYVRETIYIYAGFLTTCDDTILAANSNSLPTLRPTTHTVTYHYGSSSNIIISDEPLAHGAVILTVMTPKTPAHSTPASWTFGGWYYDSGATTTVVESGDLLIKPTDLYAKWNAVTTVTENFSVSLNWGGTGTVPTITPNTASFSYLTNNPNDYTINIDLSASTSTSYEWTVDFDSTPLNNTNNLVINKTVSSADADWFNPDGFTITLTTANGSVKVTFTP